MKKAQRWSAYLGAACLLMASSAFLNAQPSKIADKATTATKKAGKQAPAAPIDINNATQAQLESVPGIGTSTAKKIISNRPYSSVSDLSKAGLSANQLKALTPMLTAGPAPSKPSPTASTDTMKTTTKAPAPAATTMTPATTSTMPTTATKGKAAAANAAGAQTCAAGEVWANTETKVYHSVGDRYYGNTKHGKCMAEADAQKAGYHASKQKMN